MKNIPGIIRMSTVCDYTSHSDMQDRFAIPTVIWYHDETSHFVVARNAVCGEDCRFGSVDGAFSCTSHRIVLPSIVLQPPR